MKRNLAALRKKANASISPPYKEKSQNKGVVANKPDENPY